MTRVLEEDFVRVFPMSLLALTLASVASFAASAEPRSVELGDSFQLEVGESARIESEDLQIGFENVSGDSRCPKGEQCIWEGDATVRVWLRKASETTETLELHTAEKEQSEGSCLGYGVKLLRLDPYPVSGKTIEQGDYLVTLQVSHDSSSAAPVK